MKVDLVISDLRMDEMDGAAVLANTRRATPGMPVIILTAHGSVPDAGSATQRRGVFSFLTKPVDKDALLKAVMRRWSSARRPPTKPGARRLLTRSPADAAPA